MNNELKFGQRVIAWTKDKEEAVKGRYILSDGDTVRPYYVLPDGYLDIEYYNKCELDPDATEFLTGDVVEVDGHGLCEYLHTSNMVHFMIDKTTKLPVHASIFAVRYPRPEKLLKERLDESLEGGAKCILMNEKVASDHISLNFRTVDFVRSYTYKGIPVCITGSVDEFEVVK